MSFQVRDGKLDVVVVAGPRVDHWSTVGARTISMLCSEVGLDAGLLGGDQLIARGVIPLPQTGGIVLMEDSQRRIHRIRARALIRLTASAMLPDPFPGWWSEGLIPLPTALRLQRESQVSWDPATVILGTGNGALSFGAALLDMGVREVFCVESYAQWGAKRFSGWEVARRRFEIAGGKILEAVPIRLSRKAPLLWEIRLEDSQGVRIIEAGRVVSAGPFRDAPGVREHPPGSLLFDLEQTAPVIRAQDVDGWSLEEERARALATKIIRALASELSPGRRELLEKSQRRAKNRLRRYVRHRTEPFTPTYQGKWIVPGDSRVIRAFSGVPKELQKAQPVASIECLEDISCNLCETACPEGAIDFSGERTQVLTESKCTACGICVSICPSSAPIVIHERESLSMSRLTLPWRRLPHWKEGELSTLLNRRGETMGSGRVVGVSLQSPLQLVQVEVPTHLVWEVRGLTRKRETVEDRVQEHGDRVAIQLDGEKRLVRDAIPVSLALFEIGYGRAQDVLFCPDGSCGLCQIEVDGSKRLACKTQIHPKMSIRLGVPEVSPESATPLCACLGITRDQVVERIRQGKLRSPEALLSAVHVGEGRCHGQLCIEALQRVFQEEGIENKQWVDWRFPWSEWVITSGA